MHISQMAARCPSSVFLGRAILRGFRFQINERGVANVLQSDADFVEGLMFSVSSTDKKRLDRNEGVNKGFYEGRHLPMRLWELEQPINTVDLARMMSDRGTRSEILDHFAHMPTQELRIEALIYVSSQYCNDGYIRQEYSHRMQRAVTDALLLGLSELYIYQFVDPFIRNAVRPPEKKRSTEQLSLPISGQYASQSQPDAQTKTFQSVSPSMHQVRQAAQPRQYVHSSNHAIAAARVAHAHHSRAGTNQPNTQSLRDYSAQNGTGPSGWLATQQSGMQSGRQRSSLDVQNQTLHWIPDVTCPSILVPPRQFHSDLNQQVTIERLPVFKERGASQSKIPAANGGMVALTQEERY